MPESRNPPERVAEAVWTLPASGRHSGLTRGDTRVAGVSARKAPSPVARTGAGPLATKAALKTDETPNGETEEIIPDILITPLCALNPAGGTGVNVENVQKIILMHCVKHGFSGVCTDVLDLHENFCQYLRARQNRMKKLYQLHRKRLMAALPDGLVLLVSSAESTRNSDVHYLFRQESNFLYLSGITEPNHALLLDSRRGTSHLFIPDIDTLHQIWVGRQLNKDEAKSRFAFDRVHYISELAKIFSTLKKNSKKFYALKNGASLLHRHKIRARFDDKKLEIALGELRVRKSPAEIKLLQQANNISKKGHLAAMRFTGPDCFEFEVQATLEKEFLAGGAHHNAYPSIVATGKNGAILHYHNNNSHCEKDDLLLIDAGCEIAGYASDITRTFPVSGHFSKTQAEIYQIVLNAQKNCISMVKPGVSMVEIHLKACHIIAEGLIDLGFYKIRDAKQIVDRQLHRYFFPHGIGHMLGLDVHDVGARDPLARPERNKPKYLRSSRKLEAGMVITVEPGIYFIDAHFHSKETRQKTRHEIDWARAEKYKSVGGIRIEDDIVVTKNGHKNLTSVPKEIVEIERIMGKRA